MMGTYTRVAGLTPGNRPLYQRVGTGAVAFLFYWPSTSSWRIGSNFTSSSSGVKSTSTGALCPDQATGWRAYTGARGKWVSKYPITVVQVQAPGNAPL